ncbi:MAG: tetratricopeptide repeat protein [Sedimentisphaerales bacterium]|nr:tetratricopeptide repeat protein [Sedimentisphaerales bacterium]
MLKCRMRYTALALCAVLVCGHGVSAKTWRLKADKGWKSIADDPEEQFRHAMAEIKNLVYAGESKEAKKALEQLKEEFPERVGPDTELFIDGEIYYWHDRYAKAMAKYEKLLKDFPGSEFVPPVLEREFVVGQAYLNGRKKSVLGLIKISGHAEGIEIMERISDRAGLDDPNSIGLDAALTVAEHFEQQELYIEAYLKWSEIASYWESGPVGKKALYRMAENNLAAYNAPRVERRHYFDASKLTTAKTYYQRFASLYPEEAETNDVPDKVRQIDEQMSYKELTIAQYYQRIGEDRAARLYFETVVQNWPESEAAEQAREALAQSVPGEQASGN